MAVNRERAKFWREVTSLDLEYNTLDEAINTLEGYRRSYGGAARIEKRDYAYDDGYYWAVMVLEDETDKEMNRRNQRELAEFERLRAKFGG